MARRLFLISLLLLAACGPLTHTEYQMIPPATENGRMCANYCVANQQNCQQSCRYQEQQCRANSRAQAARDYQIYVEAKQRAGAPIKKGLHDFDDSYLCDNQCIESCEGSYRACHANCGGQVITQTVCDFNCGH